MYETDVDYGTVIQTTLTSSGDAVEAARSSASTATTWCVVVPETGRPKNKMVVLQLCVDRRGLAFQIFHANHVSTIPKGFFGCRVPTHHFLCVVVANAVELRHIVAEPRRCSHGCSSGVPGLKGTFKSNNKSNALQLRNLTDTRVIQTNQSGSKDRSVSVQWWQRRQRHP
ncbi:unnamed protein product [Urochloa humidicola]